MSRSGLYIKGFKDGIPIFLGYLAVSFTFGIAAVSTGISPIHAVLISATNFTSAGQFASLSIIASSLSYIELALTQLVINLRYCLMSSALSQKFSEKMPLWHRFIIAFGNTDEVFGVASCYPHSLSPAYCYGLLTTSLSGWVLGTVLGSVSGNLLPARVISALSIALYGMFIAIIMPAAKKSRIVACLILTAMCLSTVCAYISPLNKISSGFRIIILTVVISGIAAYFFPIKDKEGGQET